MMQRIHFNMGYKFSNFCLLKLYTVSAVDKLKH